MSRLSQPESGQGRLHPVRRGTRPGMITIPTRLSQLAPQVQEVLLLDEIKALTLRYNRATGKHLTLCEVPQGGWCSECQTYLEAGQRCGCRS
ncbi:hypothetical protein GCM10022631_10650 [Deinococcus rubellus]|uniref:hypothetical protein n=1 Tax=Deinococcus rubellus TaxID=1889240 RepID=UPI0031ED9C41